jgi:Dna[CI] antecedent, DciA
MHLLRRLLHATSEPHLPELRWRTGASARTPSRHAEEIPGKHNGGDGPSRSVYLMNEDRKPENLSDVLGKLFAARGWGRLSERLQLEEAWAGVVEPRVLALTRVSVLRRGVLEIEVADSILLQELAGFQKRTLLTRLKERFPPKALRDLKFRKGHWSL